MMSSPRLIALVAGLSASLAACGGHCRAAEDVPEAAEVTIIGNVMSNIHTGEKEKSLFVLAYDGTPGIKAEFEKIMADYYPEKGLDADAARKLQKECMSRLVYQIDGPHSDKMYKEARWTVRGVRALTGKVSVRDGVKWITATKYEAGRFKFPARMLEPDKPFVMPKGEPLVLKVGDRLTLRCIRVPAGRFFMGEPYYQCPHWQEDPPHMVTLTKDFYMSEHPVTQEIYEAVMGHNPSKLKGPKLPVHMVSCVDMYKFCRGLAEKTGRKVRVPTAAEWEYAARSGTSNPTFPERYKAQNSNANQKWGSPPLPVKSKAPNAWGFYDMHSGWWERVSDGTRVLDRTDVVDPTHIPPQDRGQGDPAAKHSHMGKGQWSYAISEIEYISSEPGEIRFRVVVEAEEQAGRR